MEFVDLKAQYKAYKAEIDNEINRVIGSCAFINGPIIAELEEQLSLFVETKSNAIGCASGTDALILALLALELKPGDEVIVPDFTFIATAETVALLGGVPVFADIKENTFLIDPEDVEKKITNRTKGIIGVSLFGQCADFISLADIANKNKLWLIEDAAQSFGAKQNNVQSCTLTDIAVTSFFPAKPLGCYGDGGALFCKDDSLAAKVKVLRNHGQEKRYVHSLLGINGRLDSIQAAVLKVKLLHFPAELRRRNEIAMRYSKNLKNYVSTPVIENYNTSTFAQYTVQNKEREKILKHLQSKDIPTAIHYPIPLHEQSVFNKYVKENHKDTYCVTNTVCKEVFSLPMHPFLSNEDCDYICEEIIKIVKS
jgi:UDP-2-acetamido-2-deoxy-ribo-hexuluronate aminotransferase